MIQSRNSLKESNHLTQKPHQASGFLSPEWLKYEKNSPGREDVLERISLPGRSLDGVSSKIPRSVLRDVSTSVQSCVITSSILTVILSTREAQAESGQCVIREVPMKHASSLNLRSHGGKCAAV